MSKKMILVRYDLDNGVPLDGSSENILEAYIPKEFIEFLEKEKFISELWIKELQNEDVDIELSVVNDENLTYLENIVNHVENTLIRFIDEIKLENKDGLVVSRDLDEGLSNLLIWLEIRKILKKKISLYEDNIYTKLVIG